MAMINYKIYLLYYISSFLCISDLKMGLTYSTLYLNAHALILGSAIKNGFTCYSKLFETLIGHKTLIMYYIVFRSTVI